MALQTEKVTGKVLFLRYGESESNVANTFSGMKDDALLTPKGEEEARKAGTKLAESLSKIDRIVASPLIRAQRTAQLVAKAIGFSADTIETDPRFAEYDMGELTGKPRTDVTSARLIVAPGAEDPQAFMRRVSEALSILKESEGTVLVVAHAGVGRIIRCYEEGLDPAGFYDLPAYPNATIIALS